jgi:Lrp/AsnC family transcriptional regulator, regulator for asnA, asnC and gidA
MIDELDRKIIDLLTVDARQSSKVLAKKLNVDSSTIRRRILQLIKDGAIYMAVLPSHQQTGFPIEAIIGLDVEEQELQACLEALSALPESKFVSATSGRFNVIATVFCTSTADVFDISQNILNKFKGIKSSETFVCMNIVRSYNPLDCHVKDQLSKKHSSSIYYLTHKLAPDMN